MTDYVKCVICGGEIRDDHDAELLDHSGDPVHSDCRRDVEEPETGDQAQLTKLIPDGGDRVTIGSNDRTAFVGKTGSGKTYAAKRLIWKPLDRVIFHDWKDQESGDLAGPVLRSLDQVHEALFSEKEEERLFKFSYVPDPTTDDYAEWDELCRLCFEAGDIHLIGDEVKGIYQEGNSVRPVTDHHEAILTRGRSRGVGITDVSQRPKKIPMEALSEAEHLFAFRLNLSDDRDRIGEIVGREWSDQLGELGTGEFLYYYEEWDEPRICDPI